MNFFEAMKELQTGKTLISPQGRKYKFYPISKMLVGNYSDGWQDCLGFEKDELGNEWELAPEPEKCWLREQLKAIHEDGNRPNPLGYELGARDLAKEAIRIMQSPKYALAVDSPPIAILLKLIGEK